MQLDPDTCFRALAARDRRFDGAFYVGVTTTGIYCRPVCPARTPARDRCLFFRSAAEAERAAFRACFRCRPELAPAAPRADASPLVARAVVRIEAGALDGGSVDDLARALGVTGRHLRRRMQAEIGVGPLDLAQTRRLGLAKRLLQDTALPLAEVALTSGFGSVRRFNAAFRARFDRAPSAVRRDHGDPATRGQHGIGVAPGAEAIAVRLDHRPPLDWDALLAFLSARSVPGVERVERGAYRRTVRVGERVGWLAVRPGSGTALAAEVSSSLSGVLVPVVARLRALLDLDAHPAEVDEHLGRDALLSPLVRRHPGLRVPGAFDPFEAAARAVLGQQVSVAAATTLAGRLARAHGAPVATPFEGLDRAFPPPAAVAALDEDRIASLGMPGARARTLLALARGFDALGLERGADPERAFQALRAVPGVGPWTASYVALRALGAPDAFPAADLGLRKALG
ncbi:MAG TPA: AlkA N-terminal domain-containing protein, partial [Anaeromyxobacteraceae bacterium]|nr:AlkA N-terminal domain-containing protein [Anaeromyxobacteraceae bacterium]